MLCCLAEIGCLVFGIIALVMGKFKLTGSRWVQGTPARLIGVLLLLPLIIGYGGEAIYGAIVAVKWAKEGKDVAGNLAAIQKEIQGTVTIIHIAGGIPLIAAFIVALVKAKPMGKLPRRQKKEEVEEEDFEKDRDFPRRPPTDEE
jgi:hypothetical protein